MTTIPESHRDLLDADVATLATVDPDGLPQQTAVWFIHEDGQIKLSLNTARRKAKNLIRQPQCSLLIFDPENVYRYLEVRGRVRIDPDDDLAFTRKVSAKYDHDLTAHVRPGEARVIVTIEPVRSHVYDQTS